MLVLLRCGPFSGRSACSCSTMTSFLLSVHSLQQLTIHAIRTRLSQVLTSWEVFAADQDENVLDNEKRALVPEERYLSTGNLFSLLCDIQHSIASCQATTCHNRTKFERILLQRRLRFLDVIRKSLLFGCHHYRALRKTGQYARMGRCSGVII